MVRARACRLDVSARERPAPTRPRATGLQHGHHQARHRIPRACGRAVGAELLAQRRPRRLGFQRRDAETLPAHDRCGPACAASAAANSERANRRDHLHGHAHRHDHIACLLARRRAVRSDAAHITSARAPPSDRARPAAGWRQAHGIASSRCGTFTRARCFTRWRCARALSSSEPACSPFSQVHARAPSPTDACAGPRLGRRLCLVLRGGSAPRVSRCERSVSWLSLPDSPLRRAARAGSDDMAVKIWNPVTGELLSDLRDHKGAPERPHAAALRH
jgi:hypothetical protein